MHWKTGDETEGEPLLTKRKNRPKYEKGGGGLYSSVSG